MYFQPYISFLRPSTLFTAMLATSNSINSFLFYHARWGTLNIWVFENSLWCSLTSNRFHSQYFSSSFLEVTFSPTFNVLQFLIAIILSVCMYEWLGSKGSSIEWTSNVTTGKLSCSRKIKLRFSSCFLWRKKKNPFWSLPSIHPSIFWDIEWDSLCSTGRGKYYYGCLYVQCLVAGKKKRKSVTLSGKCSKYCYVLVVFY